MPAIDDCSKFMKDYDASQKFITHSAWDDKMKEAFGDSTTWDVQLETIENFEAADGAKIPIYSFYLESK